MWIASKCINDINKVSHLPFLFFHLFCFACIYDLRFFIVHRISCLDRFHSSKKVDFLLNSWLASMFSPNNDVNMKWFQIFAHISWLATNLAFLKILKTPTIAVKRSEKCAIVQNIYAPTPIWCSASHKTHTSSGEKIKYIAINTKTCYKLLEIIFYGETKRVVGNTEKIIDNNVLCVLMFALMEKAHKRLPIPHARFCEPRGRTVLNVYVAEAQISVNQRCNLS